MTITNGYATLAQARDAINTQMSGSDTSSDSIIEMCVEAASRAIDRYTGRKFWQDATVQTREFYADDPYCLESQPGQVLDISTTTGLIVKADDADTGAFGTTYTITTQFIVTPPNAGDDSLPYTGIRLVDGSSFPMSSSGRPGIQVTAKFGYTNSTGTCPTDITKACLLQAVLLYKSTDAPFGVLNFGDGSGSARLRGLHPQAEALVAPYAFPRIG